MMTSWIAIDDLIAIYHFLIEERGEGIFNAVAPHPVSNATFTKALGQALHRPTLLPLPKAILKLMYGEASCVLIDSKEIYPKRLVDAGFDFKCHSIEDTLNHLLC